MDKQRLRERYRTRVETGSSLLVVSGLFVWLSQRVPGTIAGYSALPDEVDIAPLFERLPGWRWVIPRIEDDHGFTFRDRDLPLERHRWGFDQPIDSGTAVPEQEIDVILAPGLAFDRSGARLGRGGGYYDRILARRRADAVTVGVTILDRIIDRVPMEDHDRRVGWLATEDGVSECSL